MGCKHSKFVKPKTKYRYVIVAPVYAKRIAETKIQEHAKEEKEAQSQEEVSCKDADLLVDVTDKAVEQIQHEDITVERGGGKEDGDKQVKKGGDEVECQDEEADEYYQWDEDEENFTQQYRASKVKIIQVRPMAARGERTIIKRAEQARSAIALNIGSYVPKDVKESNSCSTIAEDDSDTDNWEREEDKAMSSYQPNVRTINVRPQAARGKRTVSTKHDTVQTAVKVVQTRELDKAVTPSLATECSSIINTRDVRFRPKAAKGTRTPVRVGVTGNSGMMVPTDNMHAAQNRQIRSYQAKCLREWMERQKRRENTI